MDGERLTRSLDLGLRGLFRGLSVLNGVGNTPVSVRVVRLGSEFIASGGRWRTVFFVIDTTVESHLDAVVEAEAGESRLVDG